MKANDEVIRFLHTQPHVTLGFSTGKDSLACAVLLKQIGVKFTPFFFFHIPDLEFVERNIVMYEDLLDMQVIRLPHPMLYDYLRHQDFMPPQMVNHVDGLDFPRLTFEDLIDCYMESIGDPGGHYDIVGARASESLNRRLVFKKRGFIDHKHKKVYPIADWNTSHVLAYLKSNNMPLTPDYKIWNRSFDGLKYQFLFGVKEHYPADWQRIKDLFPLIDLELFRYEANQKYFQ